MPDVPPSPECVYRFQKRNAGAGVFIAPQKPPYVRSRGQDIGFEESAHSVNG